MTIRLGSSTVDLAVVGHVPAYPGVATGDFVVVSADLLRALDPADVPGPSLLLLRGPDIDLHALRASLAAIPGVGRITISARSDVEDSLRAAPAVQATRVGLAIGALVVVPYGVVTVVIGVALAVRGRRREDARLAVLGLTERQTTAAAAVEFLPVVVVAAIGGLVLGTLVAVFTEPALGLPALMGVHDLGPVDVSPASLAPVLGVALAVAAAAALGCTLAGRRQPLAEAARE